MGQISSFETIEATPLTMSEVLPDGYRAQVTVGLDGASAAKDWTELAEKSGLSPACQERHRAAAERALRATVTYDLTLETLLEKTNKNPYGVIARTLEAKMQDDSAPNTDDLRTNTAAACRVGAALRSEISGALAGCSSSEDCEALSPENGTVCPYMRGVNDMVTVLEHSARQLETLVQIES